MYSLSRPLLSPPPCGRGPGRGDRTPRWLWLALLALPALPLGGCGGDSPGAPDAGARGQATASAPDAGGGGQGAAPTVSVISPGAPPLGSGGLAPRQPEVSPDPDAPPLAVVVSGPRGPVTTPPRPVITFDRPVKALGAPPGQEPATISPSIEGKWRWLGSSTAEFVPTHPMPWSTQYTVTAPEGLVGLDGGLLKAPHTFTFETPRLKALSGSPINPWQQHLWATADQPVEIIFNQRPHEADLPKIGFKAAEGAITPVKILSVEPWGEAERRKARARGETPPVEIPRQGPGGAPIPDRRVVVRLAPAEPLALDTQYSLVIPRGMRGAEGPLASESGAAWPFRTYAPLAVRWSGCKKWYGACPEGPITLTFSTPVEIGALKAALQIQPPVQIAWPEIEGPQSEWTLYGDFTPSTDYRIKVAAGLKDSFGQRLDAHFEGALRTGDLDPQISGAGARGLLERGLRAALPLSHVNMPQVAVRWAALTVEEALTYMQAPYDGPMPAKAKSQLIDLPGERNREMRSPLDLAPLFKGAKGPAQIALVETAASPEDGNGKQRTLVQITDLGVHMKVSPVASRVMVWRLSTGAPVPEAKVELLDQDGKVRFTGQTDATGLVEAPGVYQMTLPKKDKWGYPVYGTPFLAAKVTAAEGDDVAYTSTASRGALSPWRLGVGSDWASDGPRAEGLLFTERGIYRPGEPMYVKGVLRVRRLGRLAPPDNRSLTVTLVDPTGKTVVTQTLEASEWGSFHTQLVIPKEGRLGQYQVQVSQPDDKLRWQTEATVAEYRPPAFLVDVMAQRDQIIAGAPVAATVEGRYLFGAAMPGASVRWSMQVHDLDFKPPTVPDVALDAYVFGRQRGWWLDEVTEGRGEVVAGGMWTLDEAGAFEIEEIIGAASPDAPRLYTVEGSVTDVDRQTLSGREGVTVHPASFYLGLKGPQGFAEAGAPFDVSVVAVPSTERAPAGLVPEISGELRLSRQVWQTVRKRTALGTYESVSERRVEAVDDCAFTTGAAPITCSLTAKAPGFYTLTAEATDGQGRQTRTLDALWITGPGEAPWRRDDDAKVEIALDRSQVAPGDTVRALIQSPFKSAEAWITVEREDFMWSKRLTLTGSAQAVEIPVTAEMIPNAYVGVVLTRGRITPPEQPGDPGRPDFRVGYAELKVSPEQKRLNISLKPDAPIKAPGSSLSVEIAVTDQEGAGVETEVTVWAVDKGVLALTGYTPPDPVATMYRPRGLSVVQSSNLSHLIPQLAYGEKGRNRGGGGGAADALDVRRRFTTTPLFIGAARTDRAGRVRINGKLPDNLTTFSLMAVAVTADDRGGVATEEVVVNAPLMARPALPRQSRVGDVFAAGVVIHTLGEDPVEVTVEGQTLQQGLTPLEPLSRVITVPPGKGVEVRFAFKAEAPSEDASAAALRFTVKGGGHQDAVESPLPVALPVPVAVETAYGEVEASLPVPARRTERLELPPGARSDVGELVVTVAASALVGLEEGITQLIDYPYGCLEQQSSRLIPFVALKGLMDRYGQSYTGERAPAAVVAESIAAILDLQRGDGGFGYWPGAQCAHYWGSAYATLALGEADRQGYDVPAEALARARRYLKAEWDPAAPCEAWRPRQDEARAFAAFVLARQGDPQVEWHRRLFERRQDMALFGRALLAQAEAAASRDAQRAKSPRLSALIDELLAEAKVSPRGVQIVEANAANYAPLFSSDTRTTAIALSAVLAARADHPYAPGMVRTLLAARRGGRWRSTQETAFALMALADYSAAREAAPPELVARITLGDDGDDNQEEMAVQRFQGPSLGRIMKRIPVAFLSRFKGRIPLIFSAEGQGPLHYSAVMRYAPGQINFAGESAGLTVQRWITRPGQDKRLTSVQEGDVVQVRLRVANEAPRYYVVVHDPVPAGLEAIDTTLATSAQQAPQGDPEGESADLTGRPQWFSPFNHTEMRDAEVVLFADHLPPGVHEYSYTARATVAGTFLHPGATAEEMYAPEIRGRSEGGQLWIYPVAPQASAR